MNNLYHLYNYQEDNSCYTWVNESRDWHKHIHNDLEKHDEDLTHEAQSIRKNIEEAEESILKEVREVVVNTYLIPLKNTTSSIKTDTLNIQSTVKESNNLLSTILNKIILWDIK